VRFIGLDVHRDFCEIAICEAGRVADAAKRTGLDRLALSTQCGFASDASGNLISEARQEEKLHLVAEIAHEVWA
jgi:5-methyltetrahydropteroyltriglutamate--homocysteine methyltransferase